MYEVILGPAAKQAFRSLPAGTEQRKLADALRRELRGDPNAATRIRFDGYGKLQPESDLDGRDEMIYMASPLSFMAYTAVYRHMTEGELDRLSREQQRPAAGEGFLVVDILRPELGFTRWTWSADD